MSSAKWRLSRLGLNELKPYELLMDYTFFSKYSSTKLPELQSYTNGSESCFSYIIYLLYILYVLYIIISQINLKKCNIDKKKLLDGIYCTDMKRSTSKHLTDVWIQYTFEKRR